MSWGSRRCGCSSSGPRRLHGASQAAAALRSLGVGLLSRQDTITLVNEDQLFEKSRHNEENWEFDKIW